jgi:tagatose-6-phosphate ketose/aldose isomerase
MTTSPALAGLLARDPETQRAEGYADTLREILQQPETWERTGSQLAVEAPRLRAFLDQSGLGPGAGQVLLTGSGSSLFAAQCALGSLRRGLGTTVGAVAAGDLLTHPVDCLPAGQPLLFVSLARSGNSPESVAAVERVRTLRPDAHHLAITCNAHGRLAEELSQDPRALVLVLDERTHDRSLVMTSSFTNLALAASNAAIPDGAGTLERDVRALAESGRALLRDHAEEILTLGRRPFGAAVVLGTADRLGAAREGALKLTEMTAGAVRSSAESFLGLRHGPMSAVHSDTLLLALLSPGSPARDYERDLLDELRRKGLGGPVIVVGAPPVEGPGNATCIALPDPPPIGLELLDVVVAQLLAFSRSLMLGLRPDAPSRDDVITRVVPGFKLYEVTGS